MSLKVQLVAEKLQDLNFLCYTVNFECGCAKNPRLYRTHIYNTYMAYMYRSVKYTTGRRRKEEGGEGDNVTLGRTKRGDLTVSANSKGKQNLRPRR